MAQGDRPGKKPFDPAKAEQMKSDFIRGAKFAPMDLLGAPVDLATMAMRGVGIPVPEKPFLGSEYLIDKYADLGEAIDVNYDRPTGSGMETLGRVMAGTAGLGGEAAVALAPGIGKLFAKATKTRGSGTEVKGSGNIEMEASPSDLGPLASDEIMDYVRQQETPDAIKDLVSTDASDAATYYLQYARGSDDILDTVSADTLGSIQAKLKADSDLFVADHLGMKVEDLTPDTPVTVYRVGDIKAGEVQSFSLDSGIGSRSLPGQELRQRQGKASQGTGKYTVRAGDILAAPESTVPGISGLNEKEILIDGSSVSSSGPMVKEAGSDGFVPLEKTVGAPGTPGVDRSINKPLEDEISVDGVPLGGIDYLPVANALLENTVGAGKKGLTGAQYLARLKNQPSVTDMELEVSGLDKFLAENANRKIPVDDVLDYHVGNSPRIEMVDGGAGNVSYQRMFGDESYTAQGRDTGIGGYEEVVFRDARFAVGNKDLAPGAVSDHGQHHSELGPIGHGRMTSFDDVATGGERSTILEENQADLYEAYKGGAAREAEREGLIGRNLVQLTPDKVKTFKAIEQKIEDGAQYRTLNDAITSIDDETRMLKEIESNQRTVTADLDGIRKRNFLQKSSRGVEDAASPDFRFAERLKMLQRSKNFDESSADIMGLEMRTEADLGNIIKQAVIEDTRALDTLSNDQLSKVLRLAADRSMRQSSDTSIGPSFVTIARAPLRDDELKQILDIPEAITGAEEDVLQASYRLISNVQSEFKGIFDKGQVVRELGGPSNALQAVQAAKNLLPKAVDKIDPKLLRKDAASFRKLSSEDDLFKQSIDDQKNRIEDAKARPTKIYMDAIEAAAPDKKTAFEYVSYRQNQGKLAVDDAGVDALKIHFSQDSKGAAERGFGDPSPEFTNPLPFETQEQVARYQLHQMIKKAADDGSTRFYIPDYRDIFAKRELEEDKLPAFVSRYKTPQEKVIKELKQKYPDIDIGTVDTVQPAVNRTPLRDNQATKDYMLEIERPEHDFPMTYIDLTPLQAKPSQVRRYKRGGKVDMRSGIGDLFKVYS